MTREQKPEAALRIAGPIALLDYKNHPFILLPCEEESVSVIKAGMDSLSTPLDPNTRVVHVKLLSLWVSEWEKTVSMASDYCAVDKILIDEIRAIIREVKE